MKSRPLIYLFGYPGVGKNTVANEIEKRSDYIAVQNHLISNAFRHLVAKCPAEEYAVLEPLVKHHTMKAWLNFLEFVDTAMPRQGLVFTSVLYQNDPDRVDYAHFIRDWAQQRKRAFIPVRLTCSHDEMLRRLQSAKRSPEYKLTDPAVLEKIIARYRLWEPQDDTFLDLDTTALNAEDTAQTILAHVA